ncbi:unnamed protein product [Urochloa humidicola]
MGASGKAAPAGPPSWLPGVHPARRQDAAGTSASSIVGSLPWWREARFGPRLLAHGRAPARRHQQAPFPTILAVEADSRQLLFSPSELQSLA